MLSKMLPQVMGLSFVGLFLVLTTSCGKGITTSGNSSLQGSPGQLPGGGQQFQNQLTGSSTPYVQSPSTSPYFSTPLADLDGKSPFDFIRSQNSNYDALSSNGITAIVSGGLWKLMLALPSQWVPASYTVSVTAGGAVAFGTDPAQCAPTSGIFLNGAPVPICLQVSPGDEPSVSVVQISVQLPNGNILQKTYTLLVMRQLPNFNSLAPQCQISLSASNITVDQTITANLLVAGSVVAATLNGNPVRLPRHNLVISPTRSVEGLGLKTVTATVYGSPALPDAQRTATCSASFQVAPIVRSESCSSGGYQYNECSYANVNRVIAITEMEQLSASSCVLGSSFGITISGKIWVNHGCRANFTFQAI